jgi:predicted membrane channel-forming protein YqfA (hemolysin III family)
VLFQEGFSFTNFLVDAFTVFIFIVWLWLLVSVLSDLFRRADVSGVAKAVWVIVLIVIPYIGVFAYLVSQSRGMAERNAEQTQRTRNDLRHFLGVSPADEIEKLDRLKASGAISNEEHARLRARVVQ